MYTYTYIYRRENSRLLFAFLSEGCHRDRFYETVINIAEGRCVYRWKGEVMDGFFARGCLRFTMKRAQMIIDVIERWSSATARMMIIFIRYLLGDLNVGDFEKLGEILSAIEELGGGEWLESTQVFVKILHSKFSKSRYLFIDQNVRFKVHIL